MKVAHAHKDANVLLRCWGSLDLRERRYYQGGLQSAVWVVLWPSPDGEARLALTQFPFWCWGPRKFGCTVGLQSALKP